MFVHYVIFLPHQSILICSDSPDEALSDFSCYYHAQVARNLNRNQGLRGEVWRRGSHGETAVFDAETLIEKVADARLQQIRIGFASDDEDFGTVYFAPNSASNPGTSCPRPDYCSSRGTRPSELPFELTTCPVLDNLGISPEQFEELVNERVRQLQSEEADCAELDESQQEDSFEQTDIEPDSPEPTQSTTTSSCSAPSADSVLNDVYRLYRSICRAFKRAYREALNLWKTTDDKNSVVFPIGTVKMLKLHNVRVGRFSLRAEIQIE